MTSLSAETLEDVLEAARTQARRLLVRRPSWADDVASDVVIRAIRHEELLLTLPPPACRSWAQTVATRIVYDLFRQEQRRRFAPPITHDSAVVRASWSKDRVDPRLRQRDDNIVGLWSRDSSVDVDASGSIEDHLLLCGAIRKLSPREREVIYLFYFRDLTNGAVAMALDVDIGTVKTLKHRGLRKLREYFEPSVASTA